MSTQGAPLGSSVDASGWLVPVIAASWHSDIVEGLEAGAMRVLRQAGANAPLIHVPGCFELPVMAQNVLTKATRWGAADGAVGLGVVLRGGTVHFEYVCQAATMGLTDVAIQTGKPIGFGVLTCDNEAQARARAGLEGSIEDKGAQAAEAVLATLQAMRTLAP
ncbi:MAG: 6,7-dimethyl-8-ribityllumazine synthase [Bifidobacteriaceae bacterium]|jgi:6,7-dimethyl-8-ribityllumazine synthase|nr:6,7-dimethyl-8-ribityllumazine synthase [Bifidobacteriaceae bacterium]